MLVIGGPSYSVLSSQRDASYGGESPTKSNMMVAMSFMKIQNTVLMSHQRAQNTTAVTYYTVKRFCINYSIPLVIV